MSDQIVSPLGRAMEEAESPAFDASSLHERMRSAAGAMQRVRTEKFPVPNWAEFVHVELRVLGWDAMRKVTRRHEKIRDDATREVYIAADQLLAATERFWALDAGGDPSMATDQSWVSIARGVCDGQDGRPKFPEDGTARQALLMLTQPTNRTMVLWGEWTEWAAGENQDVKEELVEGFSVTR
jgi:hypothetical protein